MNEAERGRRARRAIVASAVGTAIEWYDFFLYGVAAALVFPHEFFPTHDRYVGVLLSFSTYFVGFAARPVGAALFGHMGDRVGRKASLIATLVMMGASTAAIGVIPGYATIGIWGAVLLTLARVLQGIAVGGEWGGSVLLAAEWSQQGRRGFAASWPQWGAPAGLLLANGAIALTTAGRGRWCARELGLADPIPREHGARRAGPVDPHRHARAAGLRPMRSAGDVEALRCARCCARTRAR